MRRHTRQTAKRKRTRLNAKPRSASGWAAMMTVEAMAVAGLAALFAGLKLFGESEVVPQPVVESLANRPVGIADFSWDQARFVPDLEGWRRER